MEERKEFVHPDFGKIEVIVDEAHVWVSVSDVALAKTCGKHRRFSGADFKVVAPYIKKFKKNVKGGRCAPCRCISDEGMEMLVEHCRNAQYKKNMGQFCLWLATQIRAWADEREASKKAATPDIYSRLDEFANAIVGLSKRQKDINDELIKVTADALVLWKQCIDTGLGYKKERDEALEAHDDTKKIKELEEENFGLRVYLGANAIASLMNVYRAIRKEFPIKTSNKLHDPQEIAEYFAVRTSTLNEWLVARGIQERVKDPAWGEAKYRLLIDKDLAKVVYREEDGKKYHHLEWTNLGVHYIVGTEIIERDKDVPHLTELDGTMMMKVK